jgi:hypothetical protein
MEAGGMTDDDQILVLFKLALVMLIGLIVLAGIRAVSEMMEALS